MYSLAYKSKRPLELRRLATPAMGPPSRYHKHGLCRAATQGEHQVQSSAALKVVLGRRLVVAPVSRKMWSARAQQLLRRGRRGGVEARWRVQDICDVHLLAAEDETLLDGRDAFLLLDTLLYAGDLRGALVSVAAMQVEVRELE